MTTRGARRIGREEARLRDLFRRLLILSATSTAVGCSAGDKGAAGAGDAGSGADATSPADATVSGTDDAAGGEDGATDETGSTGGGYGYADAACNPVLLDASICDTFETLPCGLPPDAATEICNLTYQECGVLCSYLHGTATTCGIVECLVADSGVIPSAVPLTLECAAGFSFCGPGVGRRPRGLAPGARSSRGDGAGRALADAARLEAASVTAFRRLRSELAQLRAPRRLVRAAERAARDEIRHARVVGQLARRRGAAPETPVVTAPRSRSIVALALENAVEGCVRETFGALVAMRQAARAQDRAVAEQMKRIARDETRHAALAWSLARWLTPRLDVEARAQIADAMQRALDCLRCEVAATPAEVAWELGLPTGDEARSLVDGFAAAVQY